MFLHVSLLFAIALLVVPASLRADEWHFTMITGARVRVGQLDSLDGATVHGWDRDTLRRVPLDSVIGYHRIGGKLDGKGALIGTGVGIAGALATWMNASPSDFHGGPGDGFFLGFVIPGYALLGMSTGAIVGSMFRDEERVTFAPATPVEQKRRMILESL